MNIALWESAPFFCHRVYARKGVTELLNFQNVKGKAEPYQVRQFIKIVEKSNLLEEDEKNV